MRLVIFNLSRILRHKPLENSVDRLEQGGAAAEIFAKVDDLAGAFVRGVSENRLCRSRNLAGSASRKRKMLCLTSPTQNRFAPVSLMHSRLRRREDGILDRIDVLILIDKDLAELLVQRSRQWRRARRDDITVAKNVQA